MHHGLAKIHGKERKHYLANKRLISCAFCKYHRNENHGRQAKDDRYKYFPKITIRRWDYENLKPLVG